MTRLSLSNGQVAAAAASILAGSSLGGESVRVDCSFTNVGGSSETLVVTVQRSGGTARRIARFVLLDNETAYIRGLALEPSDTLLATTTNVTSVDYVIDTSAGGGFSVFSLDANGAIKNGTGAIGSGNFAVTGDLTVSGGDADLGASGTAGTLDIFPTTASKGKTQLTVTDNTGDTTTTINTAAQATTRTYTIPDALANADFILGKQAAVARTATADGLTTGTIADAGRIQHITVTSADANHIVVLPTPTPSTIVVLHVGATGFELRSSDPATIAINGGTGASAESAIAANSTCIMICVTSTAWKGFFLDADSDLAKVEAAA